MPLVHQTREMMMLHKDDDHHYIDSLENFLTDFGPLPKGVDLTLPPEITSREYEPGVRHALKNGTNTVDGGPLPWPLGDQFLDAELRCEALKKERDDKKWQEYCDDFHAKEQAAIDAFNAKMKAKNDAQIREWAAEARKRGLPTPDQMTVSQNDVFVTRVGKIAMAIAKNVIDEDPETTDHTVRSDYAERVLRGDENPHALASMAVAANNAIKDAIDDNPGLLGTNVSDGDIAFALASIWTQRALTLKTARDLALKAMNGNPDQTHSDAG